MNLHYSQIEAGIGEQLMEHPSIPLSYLTPTWMMYLRQYLHNHNITITVSEDYAIPLRIPKDQYIMQSQHLQRYSASQQRDLNLVRLYLQVHTLADMSDCTKKKAIQSWPRQAVPTKAQRRLWKRFIRSSYLRYVPYWIEDPLPVIPMPKKTVEVKSPPPQSLTDLLDNLPKQHQRLLDGLTQLATNSKIWKTFRSRRRLYLVTDGGLSGQKGTHGWILSTGKTSLFQCSGPVDGPMDTSSSTRPKLAGYASALLLIRALFRFWQTRHRSKFHCI